MHKKLFPKFSYLLIDHMPLRRNNLIINLYYRITLLFYMHTLYANYT